MNQKKKILFLCTHNSARSQMAEGLLRALYGDRFEAFSAGTMATEVNPYVARAMAEIGIDISAQWSKGLTEYLNDSFDYIVTVCDGAKEACPFFPGGGVMLHQSFTNPSGFRGSDDQIMNGVRLVLSEIKGWIVMTFGERVS
ncbi:arsenate reductase ArsC [Acetonema longum]|uniref:Protein-tyrosine phosphatase, low molecular weight n=1 Tax=Acetonema longum DSM 6540 TaxID=1009370 RepID=F7NNC1_9FIRM|nr:arsenate reductase ArsC [Acetonema longum]EGO62464.1 protein-tyrosine phosphatase, low molecular weight [Acetonema longum DSM 6540]